MHKRWISVFLFLVILVLASSLRLYRLSDVPPGVNRDEASIGYTAYSLLLTGKDEYGRFLPMSFQSFGDWKLPLYIYLTVPMVKIFGLTEVAVRLTSALAGIFSVGLTFFLVRLLFRNINLALLAMAIAAIAPWSLHLSRVESESNVAVFLTTLGAYLFFKVNAKRPWLYLVSFVLWAFTYFTYAGNHIFTTLLILGILVLFRQTIFSNKYAKIGLTVFVALSVIVLSQTLIGADRTKISGISIFASPNVVYQNIELPRVSHGNPSGLAARSFHNRLLYALETVIQNYEKSFSPEFLAVSGGTNHAHNIQNFGNMYLVEFPFLILGLVYLLGKLKDPKMKLVLWWLLVSPLAASITKDAPHTNRMFAVFPILPLTVALGIYWLVIQIKNRQLLLKSLICVISIAYLANFAVYLDRYYVHFPKNEAQYWGIWYAELTKTLNNNSYQNKRVVMTHPEQSPYIFYLFYSHYDPTTYQKEALRFPPTEDGFYHVRSFGRFEFRPIDWQKVPNNPDYLYVDKFDDITKSLQNRSLHIGQFGIFPAQ